MKICRKRLVWLEVFGIPPQAWCRKNLEKMVERAGIIIEIDPVTEQGMSMDSTKLLVLTSHLPFIEGHFMLEVGDNKYEIFVKEMERSSDIIHKNITMTILLMGSRNSHRRFEKNEGR